MSRIFLFYLIFFCGFFVKSNVVAQTQPTQINKTEAKVEQNIQPQLTQNTQNIYFVENVSVSAAGKSATESRNLAINNARLEAFSILLTRLEIDPNIANYVSSQELSDMVMSEQIASEKIAGTSYFASFNILFAKNFVDHILAKKKLGNLATKKVKNILLILAKKVSTLNSGEETLLWEEENDWKKFVSQISDSRQKGNSDWKFVIPDADIENLSTIARDNISQAGYANLKPMLDRYKSTKAYVVFFTEEPSENKVTVEISAIDNLLKKQYKLGFSNAILDKNNSAKYLPLMQKIAAKTIDYINGLEKGEISSGSSLVKFEIYHENLARWLEVKNQIETSGLIESLKIESISKDRTVLQLKFINPSQDLTIESLTKKGLNIQKKSDNIYKVF